MSIRTLFLGLCSAAFLLIVPITSQAQVFIPDQLERDWLNAEIPGIVDAGGIMDTLHPGIAECDTAILTSSMSATVVELIGVQYLDSLIYLSIGAWSGLTAMHFPGAIKVLQVGGTGGTITLGGLPPELDRMTVSCIGGLGVLDIISMPDTIALLQLMGVGTITCGPPGYITQLSITEVESQLFTVPAFVVGQLNMSSISWWVDMSAVTASSVHFSGGACQGVLAWPIGVTSLNIDATIFSSLPAWPTTLVDLYMMNNSYQCIPPFPDGLTSIFLDQLPPCFPNWPAALEPFYCSSCPPDDLPYTQETVNYCSILTDDCRGAYAGIAGQVFADIDADGQYDAGEPGIPQASITLQPGGYATACDVDGSWDIGVLPGEYMISAGVSYPYIQSVSPASHSASMSEVGDTDLNNDFAVTLIPDIQDLRVSLYADPARPGFDNRLFLTCQNYGTIPVDAELTLSYDGDQTWLGSSTAPTSSTGTMATWSLPAMAIGTSTTISVDLNTAVSIALGTDIAHTLSADPIATDVTPMDNTTQFTDSVVGSFDPNDKLLLPAMLSPAQVQAEDKPIEYTIRFQNTGTFLAERVVIVDTLSEDLQWASMQFIASSHACEWYITDGVLHVIHNDIMLPDSTSDEANSHGFVKFSMLPASDLQDGAEIVNIAHIVFDLNAPIITSPAIFRVDVLAGLEESSMSTLSVFPNPVKDLLHVGAPMTTRGVVTYAVDDVLGKRQLQGTLDHAAQIAVGELANGVYNLTIHGGGQREVVQFVKE